MIAAALTHVGTFLDGGRIQVDLEKSGQPDVLRTLTGSDIAIAGQDAAIAGQDTAPARDDVWNFGAGAATIECDGRHCKGIGGFRGVVEVDTVRRIDARNAVVRISMYKVGEDYGATELRVDDVHLAKTSDGWRIARVERLSKILGVS